MLTMTTIADKATLTVTSTAFEHEGYIPKKYTCEGENVSPPLNIQGVPKAAKSLVLIMDDPDAPSGVFDHWVVWNIRPTELIKENSLPGTSGKNSTGKSGYTGPCPPSGTHRYFFKVYALDTLLDPGDDTDKKVVEQAIESHVIAYGELLGLYKRNI
jgi:Raf kinase inhibitor-like YbhB/YbcL family protein